MNDSAFTRRGLIGAAGAACLSGASGLPLPEGHGRSRKDRYAQIVHDVVP